MNNRRLGKDSGELFAGGCQARARAAFDTSHPAKSLICSTCTAQRKAVQPLESFALISAPCSNNRLHVAKSPGRPLVSCMAPVLSRACSSVRKPSPASDGDEHRPQGSFRWRRATLLVHTEQACDRSVSRWARHAQCVSWQGTQTCAGGFVQIPAALTRQAGGSHLSQGGILSSNHSFIEPRLLMPPTEGGVCGRGRGKKNTRHNTGVFCQCTTREGL